MFAGLVGPVEVPFYRPEAIFGSFYWPGAHGSLLPSSTVCGDGMVYVYIQATLLNLDMCNLDFRLNRTDWKVPVPTYIYNSYTHNPLWPVPPVFWTGSLLKTSSLDRKSFPWTIFKYIVVWICSFWHNRLFNVVGIKIWSSWEDKSGQAEILELLFWTGILKILAKTLGGTWERCLSIYRWISPMYAEQYRERCGIMSTAVSSGCQHSPDRNAESHE